MSLHLIKVPLSHNAISSARDHDTRNSLGGSTKTVSYSGVYHLQRNNIPHPPGVLLARFSKQSGNTFADFQPNYRTVLYLVATLGIPLYLTPLDTNPLRSVLEGV